MSNSKFIPLHIAILTVSDTRTEETDTSGTYLVTAVQEAGHISAGKQIVTDDKHQIRAVVSQWIANNTIDVIITTGGTGFYPRDLTPEAVSVLFDKPIEGFGDLFRAISYDEIGTATIQSRAVGGIANEIPIFCLPGSGNACKTGWEKIIKEQLDSRTQPCHFVSHIRRNKD